VAVEVAVVTVTVIATVIAAVTAVAVTAIVTAVAATATVETTAIVTAVAATVETTAIKKRRSALMKMMVSSLKQAWMRTRS